MYMRPLGIRCIMIYNLMMLTIRAFFSLLGPLLQKGNLRPWCWWCWQLGPLLQKGKFWFCSHCNHFSLHLLNYSEQSQILVVQWLKSCGYVMHEWLWPYLWRLKQSLFLYTHTSIFQRPNILKVVIWKVRCPVSGNLNANAFYKITRS